MNPFIAFCLYVAARVFVQYLKSRPDDSQTADSLRFLLAAMNALKRKNPLTESFLVQLDVDLEVLGSRIPKLKAAFPRSSDVVSTAGQAVLGDVRHADARQPLSGLVIPPLRQGAPCAEGDGVKGIMSYRNECVFMKSAEDDANPANAPDLTEGETENTRTSVSSSAGMGSGWLGADQQLPTRERSAAHSPAFAAMTGVQFSNPNINPVLSTSSGFGRSENGETNDASTSPDGLSNRPTPNSSTASDPRQGLGAGRMSGSGRNSFEASPAPSHGNLGSRSQSEMERNVDAFFNNPSNGFTLGSGMTPLMTAETPGGDFAVPQGWGMPGQTGMTPVAEGVLRNLMQMGTMEGMDLGWDSNQ